MLALTYAVVTSLRCHSPNGRHQTRIPQTFCTFITMLWVGLEKQARPVAQGASRQAVSPTSIGIAILLGREVCQHKPLAGLMGHSHSKKLETRKGVKPNLPLQEHARIDYIFGTQASPPDFTIWLLPWIDPYPGCPCHVAFG